VRAVSSSSTLGGRFVLEQLMSRGGMGTVHRALDTATGKLVAVKVLELPTHELLERFLREAKVLSSISHPAVVRYVAHGLDGASPWLAMEWLEGEDLEKRLERGPLEVSRALGLAERLADALAETHRMGVVHRDVKPSNVFLLRGDEREPRLIDFGIAHVAATRRLTSDGHFIGTAGYMSPEQITTPERVDARADVFALGGVLYEALTGTPAFGGASAVAVLAKVLANEPALPSSLVASVPASVDGLVRAMLEKNRDKRIGSMQEVGATLRAIGEGIAPASVSGRVTRKEQRLVSVVLASWPESDLRRGSLSLDEVAELGARVYVLDARSRLLVLDSGRPADEEAALAAECALRIQSGEPAARIAVATGLAEQGSVVGPVIDECAQLLATVEDGAVIVGDAAATLLRARYHLAPSSGGFLLGSPLRPSARPSTGQRLVGREREQRFLEAELAFAFEESAARALVVTGEAGSGKSALVESVLARPIAMGARTLVARAQVLGAGSALGLARRLVRHAAGAREGDGPDAVRESLLRAVGELFTPQERPRAVDFLLELVVGEVVRDAGPEVIAGRAEPRILAEWLRRTFVAWLTAEARRGPTLVVIEDAHWSDPASFVWLGEVLRACRALPLVVLATTRPEGNDILPLRTELDPQELRLGPLGRRASAALVRAVGGDSIPDEAVEQMLDVSAGHVFFLEELARQYAAGIEAGTSPTLKALLHARVMRRDHDERRVLRAASVFGRAFEVDGVVALLGDQPREGLAEKLQILATSDLVTGGPDEWSFRHDLLRDACYELLVPRERASAHASAARWLLSRGGAEPLCIADHFERGELLAEAGEQLVQAAARARAGGSLPEALALLDRASGLLGESRAGHIQASRAAMHAMRRDWEAARVASSEALQRVVFGSTDWFTAASVQLAAGLAVRDLGAIARIALALRAMPEAPERTGPYGYSIFTVVAGLGLAGQRELALEIFGKVEPQLELPQRDAAFLAWAGLAASYVELYFRDSPGPSLARAGSTMTVADRLGDVAIQSMVAFSMAQALLALGAYEAALPHARRAEELAVPYMQSWAHQAVVRARVGAGDLSAALVDVDRALSGDQPQVLSRLAVVRARVHLERGEPDLAATLAREVLAEGAPFDASAAEGVLAAVSLAAGDVSAGLERAQSGLRFADASGGLPLTRSWLMSLELDALASRSDLAPHREATLRAGRRVRRVARAVRSPELAEVWLRQPEHVRIFDHARAAGLDDDALNRDEAGESPPHSDPPVWVEDESTVDASGFERSGESAEGS
jgi:eukaryotic-like serine/threonine-protein kinase